MAVQYAPPATASCALCCPTGYYAVSLHDKGQSTFYVHRLVLAAFVGPAPDKADACHYNGVRTDNRLTNLRWDTRAGNMRDSIRHGTLVCGERCYNAKLTAQDVRAIRASSDPVPILAATYNVALATIHDIIALRTWKHVVAKSHK